MSSALPSPLKRALSLIHGFSPEVFSRLITSLNEVSYFESHDAFRSHLATVTGLDSEDNDDVSNLVGFILAFAHRTDQPNERTIPETAKRLINTENIDLESESEYEDLRSRFVDLVAAPASVAAANTSNAERRGARVLESFEASSALQNATPSNSKKPLLAYQNLLSIRHSSTFDGSSEMVTVMVSLEELKYIAARINDAIESTENLTMQLRDSGIQVWADLGDD